MWQRERDKVDAIENIGIHYNRPFSQECGVAIILG